ncbi:ABC-three component system protein [Rahnella aceris]|uniref:ABC-three component system protein n=1 Tax=Rahnella sp. (strain Y9602) TaxID=2703885 RepID=UPI001C263387|nr:ABC-three component system protein [Rahnella aceris]MBU9848615.1 hypothetical protein [Rahnella aceris]
MSEEDEEYPASAVATWSGYVYQGKIALYHCLKLINAGDLDFELQLDSTDDFAIYKNGNVSSAHQVKAKVGKYRNSYNVALAKSAEIEFDRVAGITRYFHVSVPITDTSDYLSSNGEIVIFYPYGDEKYCGLGDIEGLTKAVIAEICNSRKIILSDDFLNYNYCILSEQISSQAIEIHRKVQNGDDSTRKAAYESRLSAQSILEQILSKNPYNSTEYYAVELKSRLHAHLEDKLDQSLPGMTDAVYERARRLYEHIRYTEVSELKTLCQLMKPSERFSRIQKGDIRRYSGLIQTLDVEPIFDKLPHYLDKQKKFYIPTALDLPEIDENNECASDILSEMKSNDDLLKLLFEYNNLIASRAKESFMIDTKYTARADVDKHEIINHIDSNIIKTLCISIVTREDAEIRLNDH